MLNVASNTFVRKTVFYHYQFENFDIILSEKKKI